MKFVKIDGGFGEGGGQIIRTAISLSCITQIPIIIENIRRNREKPGLKPQHLTAIRIIKKLCDAKIEGDKIGSTYLKFIPGKVKDSNLKEDVGTAGSIPLILQVLIPVSSICHKKLNLTINGGTDVLWSPTIDYTRYVLHEMYSRFGINFSLEIVKRGYYPKDGGKIKLKVLPAKINSICLTERQTKNLKLFCTFSKIPEKIIEEIIKNIKLKLVKEKFVVESKIKNEDTLDSGASILIFSIDNSSIIGITNIYDKKSRKFNLDLNKFCRNDLGVDENLADMLVLPASLSKKTTVFRVPSISKHLETNLFVASEITGCKYGIGKLSNGYEVRIQGVLNSSIH